MKQEEWSVFNEIFETTDMIFYRVKYLCRVGLLIDESEDSAVNSLDLIKEILKAGEVDIEKVRDKAVTLKNKAPETESSQG